MSGLIRGITLTHPWAFCIAHLGKPVENRTWRPERQGGRIGMHLAIHGGAMPTGAKKQAALDDAAYVCTHILTREYIHYNLTTDQLKYFRDRMQGADSEDRLDALFTPGIVAVARLAGVVTDSISPWAAPGQFQWQLEDVLTLPEPIPHRGGQGLWQVQPDALDQLRAAYKAARA